MWRSLLFKILYFLLILFQLIFILVFINFFLFKNLYFCYFTFIIRFFIYILIIRYYLRENQIHFLVFLVRNQILLFSFWKLINRKALFLVLMFSELKYSYIAILFYALTFIISKITNTDGISSYWCWISAFLSFIPLLLTYNNSK